MKRFLWGIVGLCVSLVATTGVSYADTNNFYFKSFHADYQLGSDSEGRSTLKTTETLVAEFPPYNQNHGIERAIPKNYDGHSTSLRIVSVTNGSGENLNYSTYDDTNNNLIVRIGEKDTYVRSTQTYVITYTQRDVTKYFANTGDDEFYWDTNGTQWPQTFGQVSATVHLSSSILPTFTKNVACYEGVAGSNTPCTITVDGSTVQASTGSLAGYETMTIALGFTGGTFRGYQQTTWEKFVEIWLIIFAISIVIGVIIIIWIFLRYSRLSNRTPELPPIPTEYIPPKDYSVLVSAQIGEGTRSDVTAQIIDLAVRHYVTIRETKEKSMFRNAEYTLSIIKPIKSLTEDEIQFVKTLFGSGEVGTEIATKSLKRRFSLPRELQQNATTLKNSIKGEYGLRVKDSRVSKSFQKIGIVVIIVSILIISPVLLIVGMIAVIQGFTITPLSDKGLSLRRYLAGLKQYIRLAEADRIKALQSPSGVEKTGVSLGGKDNEKIIKLYERVLPYAILFGLENEWNKQLAVYYDAADYSPSWYISYGTFNAAVFSSSMSNLSGSLNSYGASTSSSSGGSGGGGSAGGGGGGGGGGGW